ncbi:cyclic nucleotide-binding domain-containing protein [Hyalangium versicolor]|uniref:cyclic nucleotide-binding domain-containing protein n=1 Tax=Hyalangium versicolor TaxID=2861190 RepID=UPI001CD013BC|nr:cyclic nucleotide-binding domain-containing protein [Hyalangium versicolor]
MELRKLRDKATEAFAKGRFSKAAEIYEEYCKAEPKDYQARLRMGDAWAKAGQKDRAISAYQFAATGFAREGFLPRAIAASKLILELDPAHKGVQQMLADLYARKSAGDQGGPQRSSTPARRVELPSFTENMGVSMGPSAAPLELPEEDEPAAAPAPVQARAVLVPPPPAAEAAERGSTIPEHMEIPLHAPLEIPESPPERPTQIEEEPPDEELAVVQGVAVAPASEPESAVPAAPVEAQAAPLAPQVPSPAPEPEVRQPVHVSPPVSTAPVPGPSLPDPAPSSAPAASTPVVPEVSAPRAPEPAAPAASATPPGLAPRGSAPRPPAAPSVAPLEPPRPAPVSRPAAVVPTQQAPAASQDETSLEVDLGRGTKKLSWAALSEPLFPGPTAVSEPATPAPSILAPSAAAPTVAAPSVPLAGAVAAIAAAPSGSAPPGLRPRRASEPGMPDMSVTPAPGRSAVAAPGAPPASVSEFTELVSEADTLLQAVEEAAISGVKQRAAQSPEAARREEESILSLTDEAVADAPAAGTLPSIPLFSDLPQDAFIELFERCPLRRFSQGERVFEQGSHSNSFYVICEGSVRVFRQEGTQRKELATLGIGAFFGEMALLSGAPRMASVESATEDTQLLEISAPVLAELSRQHPQVARALKKFCRERMLSNVMSTSALFEPFGRKDRRALVEKFRAREVKRNEIIVREGDRTDGLYVVLSGEVEARKGDQVLSRMKEGELFGEISLLSKTPATATVMATRRTSLLRLPREDFDALILTHPQILVLVSELSEQRLRRTEALTGSQVIELTADELLV